MPASREILAGLSELANRFFAVAVGWHVVIAAAAIALAAGFRPSRRVAALALLSLLISVSAFAWIAGNPFNASVFALLSVVLAVSAWRGSREPLSYAQPWPVLLGGTLAVFGWVYPHFLQRPAFAYLYGAPLGLIPCPTLSFVIGASLIMGRGSKTWTILLAVSGVFYGVFGALRLGVVIDLVLLAGSLGLAAQLFAPSAQARRPASGGF